MAKLVIGINHNHQGTPLLLPSHHPQLLVIAPGGPYQVLAGQSITLRALGSSNVAGSLDYSWDVNNDSLFGDLTGANPVFSAAAYAGRNDLTIHLRVTDAANDSIEATSTIHIIPAVLYVDAAATGANTGLSWADAYTTLQQALAASLPRMGMSIKVAQGTYTPTTGADRTATFQLDGISVEGGFAGVDGANPDARNFKGYPTILSGDIGAIGVRSDNSYHVVTVAGTGLEATLDGFIVTDGNSADNGGGFLSKSTELLTVVNCIFEGNNASISGGAIYVGYNGISVANCLFIGNSCGTYGSAIYTANAGLNLANCTFTGNSSGYVSVVSALSNATESNCILWGNSPHRKVIYNWQKGVVTHTDSEDGAMAGGTNISADPEFVRVSSPGSDGLWGTADDDYGDLRLKNDSPAIDGGAVTATTDELTTDLDGNPRVVDFPCIKAAAGPVPDMGAYEATFEIHANLTTYVDANATGSGDGRSWANAYTSLVTALSRFVIGQTIEVAQGTYTPTTGTDRSASFQLLSGVAIYGGYAGISEPVPNQRDVTLYSTVLSGDIGAAGDNSDNSYHVVVGSSTNSSAILDGFTVTAGNANGSTSQSRPFGAGVLIISGNPTINGCTFILNTTSAVGMGGAVYAKNSAATITNCAFIANTAGGGGAIYIAGSLLGIVNCTFTKNSAVVGGGIGSGGSSYSLVNCILWGDLASEDANEVVGPINSAAYCDVQGGFAGTGNISQDPLFVRNPSPGTDGVWGTADDDYGELHLQFTSPCIDAGSNAAVPTGVTTDLDGNARIFDFPGAHDPGAIVDMGAYELGLNLDQVIVPAGQSLALPGGGYDFTANKLTIGTGGTLDVGDDSLGITYSAGNSQASQIAGWIASGYNAGQWNGTGIISTNTLGQPANLTGVGYYDDGAQVKIRRSWYGDTNLDGVINVDDTALMATGKQLGTTRWQDGNFNYDTKINGDDWITFILGASYASSQTLPFATIPAARSNSLLDSSTPLI